MNTVKRIMWGFSISFSLLFLFGGCKKFLDRKPLTATLDDLNQGGLEGQIFGLYGGARNPDVGGLAVGGINWLGMHALRADDQEVVADPGAGGWHSSYDLFQYIKDDWSTNTYWDQKYVFLGLVNTALQTADSLDLSDPASLINIGEAKFFRAFTFFDLVRVYGAVPKIDFRIYNSEQTQIEKSDTATIYALIDQDLMAAEQSLPINWNDPVSGTNRFPGRLTSGAAKTLHAKTLLYRRQWAEALALLEQVRNSNEYSLTPQYWQIWKTAGENNQESIFEIQAYQSAGAADNYWSWWGTEQGVRGPQGTHWNLGWGWNTPTESLVNAYEANDLRKPATILFSGQSDDPANGGYGYVLPAYPAVLPAKYWNKKTYADPNEQAIVGDVAGAAYINQRVLRYSDVLLMAAEAANELGGADNGEYAADRVNEVRERAGLPDIAFTTQAAMRDIIKHERRVEFAMEGERFFDLVRWGDAPTVLGPLGYTKKHRYYPIPTPALNANPNLSQNPEW